MRKTIYSLIALTLLFVSASIAYTEQVFQREVTQAGPSIIQRNYKSNDSGVDLKRNLVAYYHFQEVLWNGTSNEVIDSSGNRNHGLAINATTISTGKLDRGGEFN